MKYSADFTINLHTIYKVWPTGLNHNIFSVQKNRRSTITLNNTVMSVAILSSGSVGTFVIIAIVGGHLGNEFVGIVRTELRKRHGFKTALFFLMLSPIFFYLRKFQALITTGTGRWRLQSCWYLYYTISTEVPVMNDEMNNFISSK